MNKQQKKELRQRQSTRQLMGIDQLTESGAKTPHGELVYFLIRPDNLSVLSPEGIRGRVHALTNLLGGTESVRFYALNSRESFQNNKIFYRERIAGETNPAIRELLMQDMKQLDDIQATMATAREFALAYPVERQNGENLRATLSRMEQDIRNRGFHVRLAGEQDIKRLLAVYYAQDVTTEFFESYDGERVGYSYG